MKIYKHTTGWVIQVFDSKTGKCESCEFYAGDGCEYGDSEGNILDDSEEFDNLYYPYYMEQPGDIFIWVVLFVDKSQVDKYFSTKEQARSYVEKLSGVSLKTEEKDYLFYERYYSDGIQLNSDRIRIRKVRIESK